MLAFVAVLIKLAGELHGAGGWTAVPLRVLTGAGTNCVHAQVGRPGLLYEDLPSSAGSVHSSLPADGSRARVARVWRQSACVRAVAQSPSPSYTLPARRQRRAVWRAFSAAPRLAAGTAHAAGPLLAGFGHRPCFLGSEGGRLAGVQLPGSSPPSLSSSSSSQACYLPEAVSRPPRRDQGSEERPVGRCRQAATRVPPPVQPSGEERSGTFLR